MTSQAFLLSFDRIDDTQRAQIQNVVESNAEFWFHQQANVWIVIGGASTVSWRELLRVFITGVPGNLLVFHLPDGAQRSYSGFAQKTWYTWLDEKYLGRPVKTPPELDK